MRIEGGPFHAGSHSIDPQCVSTVQTLRGRGGRIKFDRQCDEEGIGNFVTEKQSVQTAKKAVYLFLFYVSSIKRLEKS